MSRNDQLQTMQSERLCLIKELESIYLNAFERIANLELNDRDIAKLSRIFLESKENAITPLQKEIEKQLITRSPNEH